MDSAVEATENSLGEFIRSRRAELSLSQADLGRRLGFRLDHEFANAFNTFAGGLIALEIALSVEMGSVWWPVQPG